MELHNEYASAVIGDGVNLDYSTFIMALMITDKCTACGACLDVCPNNAIIEGDPVYLINPNLCTECAGYFIDSQCVNLCPADAIIVNQTHVEPYVELLEKDSRIHAY